MEDTTTRNAGVIILPTQAMHYYDGNPSKIPYIYIHCLIPPPKKKTGKIY